MDQNENVEETERTDEEIVAVGMDTLRQVVREVTEETVNERLAEAGVGEVDRSRVAVTPGGDDEAAGTRNYGQAGRLSSPYAHRYRMLPEWQQHYRTPDLDHYVQQWAIGMQEKNDAKRREAHSRIAAITGERDLNTSDDSALVPSPLANQIVELMRKTQVIGPRARTFTSEATTLDVPREATFSAAAGVLEGGTITPADPTWASLTLTKKKSVVSTRSSREFIEDNAFNAVGFLSEQSARTLALYNDAQDVADGDGVGTNQTEALEEASITEVDAAVLALAYADVVDIYYAIESQYRRGAVWMAASGVLKAMSNLLDGNNRPIFNPYSGAPEMLSGGQGDPGIGTIFGRPVLEVPATAGVLLFGDLNFYGVLDHGAIRAEVSEHEAFLTDEVTWKWVQRRDGRVLQTAAFAKSSGITV